MSTLALRNRVRIISNEAIYLLIALPAAFLLVNKYPYLLIASVIIFLLIGILFFISKRSVTSSHRDIAGLLLIIYLYFAFSYFFSGQNLANFLNYSFIKRDGNFFFCYVLFFVLSVPFLNYRKLAKYFYNIIFSVFTVFSFFGIFEYFTGAWSLMIREESYTGKLYFALNTAHNATGSVLAVVCVLILVFFLKEKNNRLKLLYILILLINILGLFITKSRSSYVGFAAGTIFVLWFHYRSAGRFFRAAGIITLLLGPFIYITGVYKRIIQIFDFSSNPTTTRFELWDSAWTLFSKSPVFGIGFGRFNDIFSTDRNEFIISRLKGIPGVFSYYGDQIFYFDASHAHNSYLQFMAETGIVGLVLLILFWILCFAKIFKAFSETSDLFAEKVYLSSAGSIMTLFTLSIWENYLSATTVMVPMAILTATAIGVSWQEKYSRQGSIN
jgi:O-antigen ligase